MIKGSYTAIIVSVLLHVLLLLALIYGSSNTIKVIEAKKPKANSIESFLYKAPQKVIKQVKSAQVTAETKTFEKKNQKQEVVRQKQESEVLVNPPKKIISKPKASEKPHTLATKNITKPDVKASTSANAPPRNLNLSSYDRLSHLRNKLDNQHRQQAFSNLTQKRSASIMDGEPIPVPKTIVPLSLEQKHKLNTSSSHVGSITKNDNGTCTIYREQILGSPVEATVSSFACGESKFDKNFREHMQKVKAKLPIKR